MTVDDEEIVIPDDDEDISEDDGSDTDDGTDTDDNGNTSSGTVNKYLTTEGTVVRLNTKAAQASYSTTTHLP